MLLIVSAILSLTYRIRGGLLDNALGITGNTLTRSIWSISIVLAAILCGYDMGVATLSGAGAFAGNLISHGRYFGMSRAPVNQNDWLNPVLNFIGSKYWYDFAAMSIIGMLRGALIFAPLGAWWAIPAVAIAHPLAYSLGSTQRGEWVFGSAVGALIFFSNFL